MNLIKKIFNGLSKRKGVIILGVLLMLVMFPDVAHAATDTKEEVEQTLGFMIAVFIKALNSFLWPFLLVIGDLMDNDLIVGPGMEDRLLSIWVQIRNLVNIGFVIVLLVIALYNVAPFTEGEGNLALKTALPKLIIGLVLVNFTFVAGKVVLDVANVATTAVFALPEIVEVDEGESGYSFKAQAEEFAHKVCFKSWESDTTNEKWDKGVDGDKIPINTQLFCANEEGVYSGELTELMAATYFQDLNVNNVSIVMAVNMGALESLSLLKPEAIDDFGDLVVNSLFSLVMYIIFATTYVVLGLVLLARIVVLWTAMALSPVGVLLFVVPQLKEAIGGGTDLVDKVVKHLLAPIIIGLSMTIGFLMITAFGDIGSAFSEFGSLKGDELLSTEFLSSGIDDMEKFIIAIVSVVVIWTGVFAAAEGTAASFATGAIKGFGERIAGAAAQAPLFLTSVPVPTREGETVPVSAAAAVGLLNAGLRRIEHGGLAEDQLKTLAENRPGLARMLNLGGAGTGDVGNALRTLDQEKITTGDVAKIASDLAARARQSGASNKVVSDLQNIASRARGGERGVERELQTIISKEEAKTFGATEREKSQLVSGLEKHRGAVEVGAETTGLSTGAATDEAAKGGKKEEGKRAPAGPPPPEGPPKPPEGPPNPPEQEQTNEGEEGEEEDKTE